MAIMIPPVLDASCKSDAERKIFKWFKESDDTDDWYVLHSLNIHHHVKLIHGETDFLVLAPKLGFFALEVKGGSVCRLNGEWVFTDRHGKKDTSSRGPFDQARDGISSIMRYLGKSCSTSHAGIKRVLYGIGVMFPDIEYSYAGIDEPSWQVLDLDDGNHIVQYIHRLSEGARDDWRRAYPHIPVEQKLPSVEDVRYAASLLRSDFEFVAPMHATLDSTDKELISLTKEQYRCLDELEDNPRCLMLGGAGSGKTLLAIEQTRRCIANGEKVGLFCYNKMLGDWFKNCFNKTDGHPAYVGTFHGFLKNLLDESHQKASIEQEGFPTSDYWNKLLPSNALNALLQTGALFDRIIIDETQDLLTPLFLDVFNAALKRGLERGKWCMFGDLSMQAIYTGMSSEMMLDMLEERSSFVRFNLTINCRNTKQICDAICTASGYIPRKMPWSEIEGPMVDWQTWGTFEEEYIKLTQLLGRLEQEGVYPGDITILSPKERNESIVNRLNQIHVVNYGIQGCAQISFSTIRRFKGLENKVIILTDISDYSDEKLYYVAFSRARSKLYVLESESAKAEYNALFARRFIQ